jgi:ABC-type bacteriocin/lantibiotic exporter with double-glycine peptidase domain
MLAALPRRRRRQGVLTLVFMLLGAGAEMLGISAVLVFLTLLTNPHRLTSSAAWRTIEGLTRYPLDPLVVTTAGFVAVMLFSGTIRLALTWLTSSFSNNAGLDLTAAAFKKITTQPYDFYLNTGSDEILSRIEKIHIANNLIMSGVQAMVGSFVAVLIVGFLISLDFKVAITIGTILVGSYVAISLAARSRLASNSEILAASYVDRVKRIQQAIGGIRDILIDRSQWVFQLDFERSGDRARRPQTVNLIVQYAPRIVIEVIGMMAIAVVAVIYAQARGSLIAALPVLGGLAIGAQRLLPLLQQSYNGWSMFLGNRQTLMEIAGLLALPESPVAELTTNPDRFQSTIEFDDLSFAYIDDRYVLENVSLTIRKGERIGIVGTTGSGKSTLTDLLLGLLVPTKGMILVDGRSLDNQSLAGWQAQIAHVPQSIYLSDDTIARNIAFGVPAANLDMDLVRSAAASAGLGEFISGLPKQYDTRCGERGIRLSGGQRQRIGIARALYKRATVLVLDEATSALDNATEKAVMESISKLSSDITVIMIAHRLTSLSECRRIFRVEAGGVVEIPRSSMGMERAAARRGSGG